jgi:hypothetical protein
MSDLPQSEVHYRRCARIFADSHSCLPLSLGISVASNDARRRERKSRLQALILICRGGSSAFRKIHNTASADRCRLESPNLRQDTPSVASFVISARGRTFRRSFCSSMPEEGEQDDDRDRDAKRPKKNRHPFWKSPAWDTIIPVDNCVHPSQQTTAFIRESSRRKGGGQAEEMVKGCRRLSGMGRPTCEAIESVSSYAHP